jgi:hypothetical protein
MSVLTNDAAETIDVEAAVKELDHNLDRLFGKTMMVWCHS